MGAGHDAVIGLDQPGDVLRRMARGHHQSNVRGGAIAIAVVVEPQVAAVGCPGIHHVGVWKEGGVECVVGMMVREQDVRHSLGLHAKAREGLDDQAPIWDHSRVHHQAGVAVEDQGDRR